MDAQTAPSLSIVITSLNRARFIERLILSILKQDYPGPVQTIIADGGSTDGTVDILKKYPQLTWWSRKDKGIVDAINQGLAVANGDWVAIQDSDNFYLPEAFRLTMEAAARRPELSVVTGCDVYLQPDRETFNCSQLDDHDITPRSLMMRRVIPIHCAFIRRQVIDRVGGFRPLACVRSDKGDVGNVGIDIDFWYRLTHTHRAAFIPWHTCVYQHHDAMMSRNSRNWFGNMVGIVERAERDPELGSRFRLNEDEKTNLYIRWEIAQESINGDTARARELIQRAMHEPQFTEETRNYLRLHGYLPQTESAAPRRRHPNHRLHDMKWYLSDRYPIRQAA